MMRACAAVRQRLAAYATVPHRLLVVCLLTLVGALTMWGGITLAVRGARQGVRTMGQDTAPSIFLAQGIRAQFADMHAEAANDLLAGGLGSPTARQAYTTDVQSVAAQLVAAAKNITYPEELAPILAMQKWLVAYTGLIEEARTETRHGNPVGVAFLRRADTLIHTQLMPAAQELDAVNTRHLEAQYSARTTWAWAALALVLALGGVLSVFLVAQHADLRRTFRRRYNLGLLSALGLTLGLTLYVVWALWTSQTHLHTARKDAFDSVYALLLLRAEANQANADETLWLLAQGGGQAYAQRFQASTQRMLDPARTTQLVEAGWASSDGQQLRARGQTATAHTLTAHRVAAEAIAKQTRLQGLLGDIFANVTYPGEGENATEMLAWYIHYMAIDSLIRTLEAQGKHWEAVALCVGRETGQSNWAFQKFDNALSATLQINRHGFDASVTIARRVLTGLDIAAPVVLLLVVLGTVGGLWPRIAEFR